MNQLDVLAIGSLVRDANGGILEAHSTSTLVRADGRLIVVDTSSRHMRPAMKTSFRQLGVFMKDVDTVVLTHFHGDHVSNCDLFPNAKVLIHSCGGAVQGAAGEAIEGSGLPKEVSFVHSAREEIADGVELVHTPGHSWDSMSVFVRGPDGNYAIAGDAIPTEENFRRGIPPNLNVSRDSALRSIEMIGAFADVIVPGHGPPFPARK